MKKKLILGKKVTWLHGSLQINLSSKLSWGKEESILLTSIVQNESEIFIDRILNVILVNFRLTTTPPKFPMLTEAEAKDMPWTVVDMGGGLEFNLMLNGSTVQATDTSTKGLMANGLDSQDQVKVFVYGLGQSNPKENTKQFFKSNLMKELEISSRVTKNGLDCYNFKEYAAGKRCFGISNSALVSGFELYISAISSSLLAGQSYERIYGGIKVEWYTDRKNIAYSRDIDAAIWRLLGAWNISPIKKNN